jgi:hypothetical protein
MKITKCTSLFLAFLILVSNVGMAFSVHFCGGKVAGVSSAYNILHQSPKSVHQCCIEKAKENKGCCKDKVVKLNKKSDFTSKVFSFDMATLIILPEPKTVQVAVHTIIGSIISLYHCDANAPPLFKLYSQYVFYA